MPAIADHTISAFLASTAAKTPAPGGGAAACVTGALASSLAHMVVSFSLGKKNLEEHQPMLHEAALLLERARAVFLELAEEDAAAYSLVNRLQRLPETDPARAELPKALEASVQVPMTTLGACVDCLRHFVQLAGITNRQLRSDLGIAAVLAEASARASWWNVAINARFMGDEAASEKKMAQANDLLQRCELLRAHVEEKCTP